MKLELLEALAEKAKSGDVDSEVRLFFAIRFSISEFINLVKAAKEHLSNDTGATHMMLLDALAAFEDKK